MMPFARFERDLRTHLNLAQQRLRQLDGIEREPGPGSAGRDLADAALATQDREARALDRARVEEEIREIGEALGRLAAGVYGVCATCGKAIDRRRLRALPTARLCLSCQAATERAVGQASGALDDLPEMRTHDEPR